MTPARYQQVMQVVDRLLDRPTEERSAILNQFSNGDDSLRREVEKMLAQQTAAVDFLEESALDAITRDNAGSVVGKRVGQYRITREIGRGGMGAVYLAERADEDFQRQVAIKLVKRGMDTDFILRRFRNERQILANLTHTNIARLYNAGVTEDGLPFFAMEYVNGLPIDEYCAAQELSLTQRLRLFQSVCAAVHYAHQNLVVHRDLKPSNILVTADGTPKLLDFGIAKLLQTDLDDQRAEMTATEFRVMTPEYASPEQVRGLPVTTATDVYSLGVILYELLTGRRPYRIMSRSPDEVARLICEQEPHKPSEARSEPPPVAGGSISRSFNPPATAGGSDFKSLRGDVDNIVLMAMRKDPSRRYASVDELSEDIRRHLENHPVHARKDTVIYRAWSFIKRNKIAVTAASVIVLSLLGGIVATAWQARVARSERARTERRFNEVRKLANAVLFDYHDSISSLSGSTPVRERLVKDALEYLDSLAQDLGDDVSLRQELATAYIKVGDVQGRPYRSNLGQTDGALASYRKALTILEPLAASDPANLEVKRNLAIAFERVGNIQWRKGDFADSLEKNQNALAIRQGLFAADPSNVTARRELADSYIYVGDALPLNCQKLKSRVECHQLVLESQRKALEIRESLAKGSPSDPQLRRDLALAYMRVGFGLTNSADGKQEYLQQALESHGKALAIREDLASANPDNARDRRNLADQYMLRSDSQVHNGDVNGSLAGYRKALVIFKELTAADPSNAEARLDLSFVLTKLAAAEAMTGNVAAARKYYAEALPVVQPLLADDPNVEAMQVMASVYVALSDLSEKAGDLSAAIESYRKAVDLNESFEKVNAFPTLPADLARHYQKMGDLYAKSAKQASNRQRAEKWRAARAWFQKSLDGWQDLRHKGLLTTTTADRPDQVAREIANCDQALNK